MTRRPIGGLEAAVMHVLWSSDAPCSTRAVLEEIDSDLAYTTVMTVLNRLHGKGRVVRELSGRTFLYSPVMTEAEAAAAAMLEALNGATDASTVLQHFAAGLRNPEVAVLRQALG